MNPLDHLSIEDNVLATDILGGEWRNPDLIIAPDGNPYIYRWHIVRTPAASVYFHIQVASDPERPLHDHPWPNSSVILSGGYDEILDMQPWMERGEVGQFTRSLRKGDMVHREATEAHRLILPPDIPYTMSLFSTGPKVREWGFWYPDGWRPFTEVTRMEGNKSVHIGRA